MLMIFYILIACLLKNRKFTISKKLEYRLCHFVSPYDFRGLYFYCFLFLTRQIKDEVQAQLQWFVNTVGSLPTHINGHQHVHVIPQVCEILATVMKENGVHWTRIPVEQNLDECVWVEESRKHFYKSVITEAEDARVVFSSHGIR